MSFVVFFDFEISPENGKILDIGCIRSDEATLHRNSVIEFLDFIKAADYLIGHNIIQHDLKHLQQHTGIPTIGTNKALDTLLLSPLLFPQKPYHRLLKDDKLQVEELNNPLNDAKKAKDLFYDEVDAFHQLDEQLKLIFYGLLNQYTGFNCFFKYIAYSKQVNTEKIETTIRSSFQQKICQNADVRSLIQNYPVPLAYALALISSNDRYSITPPWVLKNYPDTERVMFLLRNTPCMTGCHYCNEALNPLTGLQRHFGLPSFRTYDGEPLQENAVQAAIHHASMLVILPTGGGKSITFQLPALMSGVNAKALTVVISPLQSLMKDQVDNLEKKGITEAVTINGLLDPIERGKALERVENGNASLLYISPESLRSVTIERLLLDRKIARFVIDEAHCFSSWGQDFRVDYLYIGEFIKSLQEKKNLSDPIPVSCFTATAKQKVIEDIRKYFKEKLGITLEIFRANVSRTNLHYKVFWKDNEEDKYNQLRSIIEQKSGPAIVYVSRTRRAHKLAERLTDDGFNAKPFHGKMKVQEKTTNQNAFITGEIDIMVATSAFGMGVDKSDVGTVIHYDISDSLENYIQEAGRAGRDENITADCYILFNEEDLDKHFIRLNQTKISSKEINQIWKAIKDLTRTRNKVSNSALEIARKAGWDEGIKEIEIRVTTAIAALEEAGYLKRGQNFPRVFANSILTKNAREAIAKINASEKFSNEQKGWAIRIIGKLFSSKSKRLSTEETAESRVDYISDQLGIKNEDVIRIIELLREEKILAHAKDLTVFIKKGESNNLSLAIVENYRKLEEMLLSVINEEDTTYHLKELNEQSTLFGVKDCTLNKLKTIINFWTVKNWVKRSYHEYSRNHIQMACSSSKRDFQEKIEKRHFLAKFIVGYLFKKALQEGQSNISSEDPPIEFSVLELKEAIEAAPGIFAVKASIDDVEDTLFYLSRIEAIKIEGGFLVAYNRLSINRLQRNNRIQYKENDYERLGQFYQQKVQQIHIVGEYAKKMIRNYKDALQFVEDYFSLNYSSFLNRYFPGSRQDDIKRSLTPEKFLKLFGELSPAQLEIIKDSGNQYIVVAAGPGSGKTKVLAHKLASLLLTEDVKHEQLLMLTFSRAAVTKFKEQLLEQIGNAANYVEIKTFHSYCFDLLGKIGNLALSDTILKTAVDKIRSGDIETSRITKSVLVVDEAQDMNEDEYELVKVLMEQNDEMRVILVGDDDQNIYGFRGANSKYMQQLITEKAAMKYELTKNYRSKSNLVAFSNRWAMQIQNRLKTEAGIPNQQQNGKISIVEYKDNNLAIPMVQAILETGLSGSSCVLTKTNEEAVQLTGLLTKNGVNAKLIQSNDEFNLSNLYELKYLSDLLLQSKDSPYINDTELEDAIHQLTIHCKQSSKLELAISILQQFKAIYPEKKYKSDWKAFLLESRLEDFINIDHETIYVATIHKAKGKEFDNVFIMLNGFRPDNDEAKRQLYVAVTRAKTNLAIHYNGNYLQSIITPDLEYQLNENQYPLPPQLVLLLTHRDIQLGYFEFVQHRIHGLQSGAHLNIQEGGLANKEGALILKFSQKFREKLVTLQQKGYHQTAARANFIVYWKKPDKETEVLVVLPEIILSRIL